VTKDTYDREYNHVPERDTLDGFSVIPARYVHVPIWKTHVGRYRKQTNEEWLFIPDYCMANEMRMKPSFQ